MLNSQITNTAPSASALQRLLRRPASSHEPVEQCDLCGEQIPAQHRHLLEVERHAMRCVCQACSILFDNKAAGGGKQRLIPERRLYLADLAMDEAQWEQLGIPVGMAFLFYSTPAAQVVAFYPSPFGPTEAQVAPEAWQELAAHNPSLKSMEPDVEALLVNRARGAQQYFLVPIDECYHLIGVIRMHWQGLSGGQEVWQEVAQFFDALRARSKEVG